jgi:hypothetical protein
VLDDDQGVDNHDAVAPDDEKPTFKVTNSCSPSLNLPSVLAEPGADDGKNVQNSLTQYTTDSRGDNEEESGWDLDEAKSCSRR